MLLLLLHACCTTVEVETLVGLMVVVVLLRLKVMQWWQLVHWMWCNKLLLIGIVRQMAVVADFAAAVLDFDQCGGRWLHDGQRNIIGGGGCGRQ